MKRGNRIFALIAAVLAMAGSAALAVPTFQVYSVGSEAGSYGPDQDTWYVNGSPFEFIVAGAYKPNDTINLSNATLLLSVPDGERGTISIYSSDGGLDPVLLTAAQGVAPFNPAASADIDILTDVAGLDGYSDKSFLPEAGSFNNHYPIQTEVSDFLVYDIGSFDDVEYIRDYNAGDGTVGDPTSWLGEIKTFTLVSTGFTQVHIDVYGQEEGLKGKKFSTTWDINPGSHDLTMVPAPGALMLGSMGMGIVGWLRRRRAV